MIQIIVCSCTKSKFRNAGITFYSQEKFYTNIKNVYMVLCPRHLLFKERLRNINVDISCKCLSLKRGRCDNCKTQCFTRCFTLNFITDKIKILSLLDVPSEVQLKKLMNIWKMTLIACFLCFCYNWIKVCCSLDNPKQYDRIKGKRVFDEI